MTLIEPLDGSCGPLHINHVYQQPASGTMHHSPCNYVFHSIVGENNGALWPGATIKLFINVSQQDITCLQVTRTHQAHK